MPLAKTFLWLAAFILLAAFPAYAQPVAMLRALDKSAGRAQDLAAPLGQITRLGTLEIIVYACIERPPEEEPETSIFLQVTDNLPDGTKAEIFSGWMFASSPAINALEHRFYDVWPVRCSTSEAQAGAAEELN